MGLETATYVNGLIQTNPDGAADEKSEGDNHLRLIKSVLRNTFPNAEKSFRFPTVKTTVVASPYSATVADENALIPVDATAGAIQINTPVVATLQTGFKMTVIKMDNAADTVTIVGAGGATINGQPSFVLSRQYQAVTIMLQGSNFIISTPAGTAGQRNLGTAVGEVAELGATGFGAGIYGAAIPRGAVIPTYAVTADVGFLMLNGETIGSVTSGADHADAVYENLYKLFWNNTTNERIAVVGGRGSSAQDDWNANKQMVLPNATGRAIIGVGAAVGDDITAREMGQFGGEEDHQLTIAEMPLHGHPYRTGGAQASTNSNGGLAMTQTGQSNEAPWTGGTSASESRQIGGQGGNGSHNNMPPFLALNWMVRY